MDAALAEAPWVVVRRTRPEPPWIAVGVRGAVRRQRWGAWLAGGDVMEHLGPEALTAWLPDLSEGRKSAVAALAAAAALFELPSGAKPELWGPTGGVGFELASGRPTATAESDLDALIRCPAPVSRAQARTWAAAFATAAAPLGVRCDVLLETPMGAIALGEYAEGQMPVMLRTAAGPRLVRDPWAQAVLSP